MTQPGTLETAARIDEVSLDLQKAVAACAHAEAVSSEMQSVLQERELLLTQAQAVAQMGSFSWSLATGQLAWSHEMYNLLEYDRFTVVPTYEAFIARVHADDLTYVQGSIDAAVSLGEPLEMDFRIVLPSGMTRWLRSRGELFRVHDKSWQLVGMAQDITDRKSIEEELRSKEALFSGAFQAALTGIALIASDGRTYVDVNDSLCKMLGYPKEELLRLSWLDVTHPDDRERNLSAVEEFFEGRTGVNMISKRYVRKDGSVVFVDIADAAVRGKDGAPEYFVTHVTDVTDRVVAERRAAQLQTQLRQSQKMEAVGQLAGGVAHDFNNILAVILNCAQFIAEDLDPDHGSQEDVQEILRAGDRAAKLVQQLLSFARKEAVEATVSDVNVVVADMLSLLRRSIGEDVELAFHPSGAAAGVRANAGQLEQVLVNLSVNARDAMNDGGTITITTEHVVVTEGERPDLAPGTYVALSVEDDGTGMDEATTDRIFEPFFTTKKRGEGTGLGLATVYGIVKQLGGLIEIDSKLGEGTRFTIFLPRVENAVGNNDPAPLPSRRNDCSESIVVVEDEAAVRTMVSRVLEKHGFEVRAFASPHDAIEHLRSDGSSVDLLLTDVVMPTMSGKELVDVATDIVPGLRTLYMSGHTGEAIAKRGVLGTETNLIGKPFNADELINKVTGSLTARRIDQGEDRR